MWRLATVLLLSWILVACAAPGGDPAADAAAPVNPPATLVDEYHIGPDDVLGVNVWRNPDLSVTVPVRPDGMISVPLIGDVRAGGKTPEAVAADVTEKLSYYVRDPQVTVVVTELNSHEYLSRVRVTGAVQTPVSIPFRQGMTVLDAVLDAGGVTEFASANRTAVYRRTEAGTEVLPVRLEDILEEGRISTNYPLRPGDIVTVPERLF